VDNQGSGDGDTTSTTKHDPDTIANASKIDTLCSYGITVPPPNNYCRKGCVFQGAAQLTAFLEITGYSEERSDIKMVHELDFEKWTYFAFAGNDWPRIMGDIAEGEDVVTIGYTIFQGLSCEEQAELYPTHGCIVFTSVPAHVFVYYMSFTEKTIMFSETIEVYDIYGK
jgi:hypothetical protein